MAVNLKRTISGQKKIEAIKLALKSGMTHRQIAREYGACRHTIRKINESLLSEPKFDKVYSAERTIEELLKDRRKVTQRRLKAKEKNNLINVKINSSKPIGLVIFGDPHLDDDGCDITEFEQHMKIVKETNGMYAGNVGDLQNNWIGRLARLYAEQSTTAREAWMLVEWMVNYLGKKWLYIVAGNHDAWSGSGDPLSYITKQAGVHYEGVNCRLALQFPNGREVRIHTRHDFSGHSQWNPNHGLSKWQQTHGRDHILAAGHKHTSGYTPTKIAMKDGYIMSHAVRVAGYKKDDRYGDQLGLPDQRLSSSCCLIIDPNLPETHPDMVKPYFDVKRGAEVLKLLRGDK